MPLITIAIALPALGALIVSRVSDAPRARLVACTVALISLGLGAALAWTVHAHGAIEEIGAQLPAVHARWHVGVDALSAPFLPVAALIVLAVLVGAPREELDARACSTLLISLSAAIGVYASLDLLLLSASWIASLVPGAVQLHRSRSAKVRHELGRTYDIFLVLGAVPIVAATFVVAWSRTHAGAALPFDLAAGEPIARADQDLVFVLLALALVIRKAVAPFHSWLPVLVERGPIGIAALMVGTHLGAFLVVRVVIPLLPEAAAADLPILAGIALVSALYSAFVGLGQRDLRRALGFVLTSQLALVLVGLAEASAASMHGALIQMIALALTSTGLLLVAGAIESRTGTTQVGRLGGLVQRFPRMAAAFLLLGLGAIGMPGTLAFVAEDLLLHGLLDGHPVIATLLLVTTVLNGVTVLRLFFEVFLGPSRDPARALGTPDLRPREAATLLGIAAAVVALGVVPGPLLALRTESVHALTAGHAAPGDGAHGAALHE